MTYETYEAPTITAAQSGAKVSWGSLAIGAAGLWAYRNGKINERTAAIAFVVLGIGLGYPLGVLRSAVAYGSE